MPNDNTHTLLPCPFCGADPITWTETISGASTTYAICESDKCREDHTVDSWNTRTPAEPKAGGWEKEVEDDHVYDVYATDPQSTPGWYRALYSQGEGFLIGEHPNARILSDVKIVRALSSAAPRITENQDDK